MRQNKIQYNKSVTSRDVAKLAGVSQSTVSRAFNSVDGKGVKIEVMKKIMEAANQIGYMPNLVARGMISGKTNMIGLVVGDGIGPFYNNIVNKFIEKVQELGKQCLVFKVSERGHINDIILRVIQFQVEAIIITAPAMSKDMSNVEVETDIPVILFNRFISGMDMSTVYVDPIEGGAIAANHLYEKGHRNIGYIKYLKDTGEEIEKKIGFTSKLRKYNIHLIKEDVADYSYDSGYEAGKRLLSIKDRPTAIFCTSDLIAMGVIDVARHEFNLEIPKDLSVMGYDNIIMSNWKAYDLTTVNQPIEALIDKTIVMLQELLSSENNNQMVEALEPYIIERGSVGEI
ncbi:LacI family DNA-binding transcriptional regulator [Clostridium sp.]|uniref:LacI family DNA-binding transcriptional regulator n=1 Tax=Clostridium sp. TaxID=1506 RepID=UPI0032164320